MANILHVEDDQVWIDIVRESLAEHRVDTARSQSDAVRRLLDATEPYDVALVDLELGGPDRAGGELLNLLRTHHPGIRRVVLTGEVHSGRLFADVLVPYGVDEVLVKQAFDAEQLREVVSSAQQRSGVDGRASTAPQRPAVFISHGDWTDGPYVQALANYLRDENMTVWYSDDQTPDDVSVDGCAVFIVVMSADAEDSPTFFQQIRRAQDLGKDILALRRSGEVFARLRDETVEDVTGSVLPGAHVLAWIRGRLERHYRGGTGGPR